MEISLVNVILFLQALIYGFLILKAIEVLKIKCKHYFDKIALTIILVIFACIYVLLNNIDVMGINYLFWILYVSFIVMFLFYIGFAESLKYSLLATFVITLSDFLVIKLFGMGHIDKVLVYDIEGNVYRILLGMLFAYIFYISFVEYKNSSYILYKISTIISVFLSTSADIYILYEMSHRFSSCEMFHQLLACVLVFVCLSINVLLKLGIDRIKKLREYSEEINKIRLQNSIQMENYMSISNKYEESSRIIHDIRKHLEVMKDLAQDERDRADEYGEAIEEKLIKLMSGFRCSNRILSIIMSQKIEEAEKKRIEVNVDMCEVDFQFINDMDMTSIFSNLWDNAIEASMNTKKDDRLINVSIGKVNNFILILFENKFNGYINEEEGKIKTTKKNHRGCGLDIISDTIEKYGGEFYTDVLDDKFMAQAIIPI